MNINAKIYQHSACYENIMINIIIISKEGSGIQGIYKCFFHPLLPPPPPSSVSKGIVSKHQANQWNKKTKQNLVMFERFDYSLDSKHFVNKIPCLTSLSLTVKK